MMLLSEVQQYNRDCEQNKTGCCLSIYGSGTERLSVASTAISRQYVQYKRRRKRNMACVEQGTGELMQQSKSCISTCCKRTADKSSSPSLFRLDEETRKHQAEDQIKLQAPDRKFFLSFLSFIHQSFSIFCNYCDYHLHSRTPSTSCEAKLRPQNQLRNKFNRFRTKFKFRFKSVQLILLILLGCLNSCANGNAAVAANANAFNLLSSAESAAAAPDLPLDSLSSLRPAVRPATAAAPTTAVNLSSSASSFTPVERPNSSVSLPFPSFDFLSNLLPSTELFSFSFYSTSPSHRPADQSTTRLPNITKNLKPNSSRPLAAGSTDHNQTKSAHFKPISNNNAFQTKFNQPEAADENSQKWPYDSLESQKNPFQKKTIYKSNRTDRFRKAINPLWSSSASTVSARVTNNYSSAESSPAYPNRSSTTSGHLVRMVPTPSALIVNLSEPTIPTNNSEAFDNATLYSTTNLDFREEAGFANKFLQPFTNLSWWTAVPFPKSGYHNYSIVFLAFFITIVMLIVVIGNLLVCIAICTEKSLKTIQNWFIASLAVSDLLLGLIIMPFSLAYELMGTWVFSDLWCDFHHALDVLLTTASINNLCLISLDRYWSVTQAIEYLKKRTPCRAIFMIIFAWVFSALVSIPPLIGWKPEQQIPGECTLSNDLGYVLYSSLGSFYIPSVVMVFVYARIFVAARSRARKHVRKKQISGGSSVQEPKKNSSQMSKAIPQPPPASSSSQDNAASYAKQPVTTSASPPASQQLEEAKREEASVESSMPKSESKGSIKTGGRAPFGRFTRRAQLGIASDQADLEENSEIETANQLAGPPTAGQQQAKQEPTTALHTISNQTTTTESSSGIGTSEEHQLNSAPTSGSSVQTEPTSTDAKGFPCTRSTSAFTYDHLFVEDRKSTPAGAGEKSQSESVVGRPATPSSKVTFSPNDIVFDLNASGTQSVSLVPQIVIHGSMQQLHLQTNAKRARFSVNKLKDSDFNNNQANEKRLLTGTLSAGQLDCVILEQREGLKDAAKDDGQPKRSSIKRSKYQNELEIDCTAAQQLNQQQPVSSPHSILKSTSSNTSPTALNKNEQQQQIELQEKTHTLHQPVRQVESILSTSSQANGKSKEGSNHVSPVSRTFSEQTANSIRQDGKLNHLGVGSLQTAASISGSMMSINYDYDSETYMDEKGSKRGFDDDYDFDDENESSNTHDENASKRSVKSNMRQSKKANIFNRWSWCKKWLWLNEKCASNQEEEFAGYEEEDEEEDEELDQIGSSIKSGGERQPAKKSGVKRILKKNRNKGYNASIISANNTSSSGTQSGTAQQPERKLAEKKSSSLFSRFSRDNSNKSTSSGSAKRTSGGKQQRSAKSTCSVAAISQSSQTGRHRKHRHKSDSQLHAHSSSTAESGVATSQYRFQASEADRQKRKVAKAREKRATLILGLIMGAFILGYIPFSSMYLIQGICPTCQIQSALTVTYWIGYTASAINPVIYTVFNRDFRKAFKKIVFR